MTVTVHAKDTDTPQLVQVWGFIDTDTVFDTLTAAHYAIRLLDTTAVHVPVGDSGTVHSQQTLPPSKEKKSSSTAASIAPPPSVDLEAMAANSNCYVAPLLVGGMSCANCSKGIENRLMKMTGILNVRVALLSGKVEVYYDATIITDSAIITQAIIDMGYTASLNGNPYAAGESNGQQKKQLTLKISGMSCASCATKIEDMLILLPGIVSATVSCLTEKAHLEMDDALLNAIGPRDVMARIDAMGYKCRHLAEERDASSDGGANSDIEAWWRLLLISILLGGPVVVLHFSMIFSTSMMTIFDIPV